MCVDNTRRCFKSSAYAYGVTGITFASSAETDIFVPFPSCDNRELIKFGEAAGGHLILALDLKSKNTADPTVEIIDSEDFDDECMYGNQSLSKFLTSLKPEA